MGVPLEELTEGLSVEGQTDHPARWNVAPTEHHPVFALGPENTLLGAMAPWGFSSDGSGKKAPINARLESVDERPMFQSAIVQGRVVVPATGWYEWKTSPLGRHPHYLQPASGGPCWMAAIRHRGGGYAILTTEATPDVADVHHRMPVLLTTLQVQGWLEARQLPNEAPAIDSWPVGMDVNRVGTDGPHLVQRLQTLF
mgnify:CR=1 FL=1